MSKHNGRYLTLKHSLDKFGADATRIALAYAGDTLDDAYFDNIYNIVNVPSQER